MKRFYERHIVTVRPLNGDEPYDTYLLSQTFDDSNGRLLVSHVSGPVAVFPDDADIDDPTLIAEAN